MVFELINTRLGKSPDIKAVFLVCCFNKVPANYFTSYKNKALTRALFTLSYPSIVESCHKCSKNSLS